MTTMRLRRTWRPAARLAARSGEVRRPRPSARPCTGGKAESRLRPRGRPRRRRRPPLARAASAVHHRSSIGGAGAAVARACPLVEVVALSRSSCRGHRLVQILHRAGDGGPGGEPPFPRRRPVAPPASAVIGMPTSRTIGGARPVGVGALRSGARLRVGASPPLRKVSARLPFIRPIPLAQAPMLSAPPAGAALPSQSWRTASAESRRASRSLEGEAAPTGSTARKPTPHAARGGAAPQRRGGAGKRRDKRMRVGNTARRPHPEC